ncbi:MAG: signal peptidase II, partial [Betaproteobacteria bacterium]|nr:signal peptidase II [Betaproteobacteria bacterium]
MASTKKFGKGGSGKSQGMALWLGIALLVLLIDQFTKVLVLGAFQLGDSTPITSFFNLVRVHNHGAAFSFLASAGG